ncbi:MAG: serine hydrolase [Chloroflexia bacterium]|nr:serine hydrolase [Chloroflexia bacterium]
MSRSGQDSRSISRLPHSRRSMLAAAAVAAGGAALRPIVSRAQEATPAAGDMIHGAALEAALEKLDALAQAKMAEGAAPGLAIAVVQNDAVVFSKGYGVRDVDSGEPVDADTAFQIASLSKPISSTVVAAIVGAGDASWDSIAADRLPGFVLMDDYVTRNASVRDCFAHRTGVPGLVGADLETLGFTRDEIMHRLRYVPVTGKFRQTYSYSNIMMTAGALAAAAPLGQSWDDIAAERLFGPLGMTNTTTRYQEFLDTPNRAALHVRIDGAWASETAFNPDAEVAGGGVTSSANDLAQWMRLQLAGGMYDGTQVIEAAALNETHIPQIMRGFSPITGRPSFYALGWGSDVNPDGRIVWRHNGAFSTGARTDCLLIPEANLGIVTLTNAFPTGTPDALNESFYDFVFHGEPQQDWFAIYNAGFQAIYDAFAGDPDRFVTPPHPASPALDPAADTGTYHNDYLGDVVVEDASEGLKVVIGANQATWPLTHWDRDAFTYVASAEPPAPLAIARFTIGDDGTATALFLESMDGVGQGTVLRV